MNTATHSSSLAWRIPQTEEPGMLQYIGSQRVGHDCGELAHKHTHTHTQSLFARLIINRGKQPREDVETPAY